MSSEQHETEIFIHDACVLIDLCAGGIFAPWFSSGRKFLTSVLVVAELKDAAQRAALEDWVAAGVLRVEDLDGERLLSAAAWAARNRVSIQDASVALIARDRGGVLLSGDARLRKSAENEGLEVRGVLWVLDLLVKTGKMEPALAAEALRRILDGKSRLPKKECDARLEQWTPK